MDHKFIQSISIDWNKIDHDSYLHSIDALKNMEALDFQKNSTFDDVSLLSSAIRMVKGYRRAKSNYFFSCGEFF